MPKSFRRIVTTNDANGRSEVLLDGPPANELASILTEMWVTEPGPHNHTDRVDRASKSKSLEPPVGGSLFRFFRLPPASAFAGMTEEQVEQLMAETFASMNAAHTRRDVSKSPGMHHTDTTDYIVLLSGKVRLVLDKEERDLEPFDAVVQRGTNHAWINTGNEEALLMAVLVDDGQRDRAKDGLDRAR
jgi:mannose-6-phosphate isomerase-like protein (cupin superfamily)